MRGKMKGGARRVRTIIVVALLGTTLGGASACRRGDANAEPAGNEPICSRLDWPMNQPTSLRPSRCSSPRCSAMPFVGT